MIKVGIVGGTGYTGVELLRLLASHPNVEVSAITSRKEAGTKVADMFPSLRGVYDLAFVGPAEAQLGSCTVVFFATPHGVAMAQARELVRAGNVCRIAVHRPQGGDMAMVLAVEDNLVKGAAGQAVQNMNLMFDLPETTGLTAPAVLP